MHLSTVDGESMPHACEYFGIATHDDMDVLGWGLTPVSEDVDRNVDGNECKSSVTNVPSWGGGVVPMDPLSMCSRASSPSAGPSVAAIICQVRSSSSSSIQFHCGDRVISPFMVVFVDAPGHTDESLPFFVIGRVLHEVMDDVVHNHRLPISSSARNRGKMLMLSAAGWMEGPGMVSWGACGSIGRASQWQYPTGCSHLPHQMSVSP